MWPTSHYSQAMLPTLIEALAVKQQHWSMLVRNYAVVALGAMERI
jgi:hypothetical protein